jgi:zinc transport system substrate-binding protein
VKKLFFGLICLLFLGAALPQKTANIKKVKIVVSVFPLMEFAKAVVGDRGEVSLLLPPGAGVHTWQPRPSDIVRLSSADFMIYIGGGLEPWIPDLLKSTSSPTLKSLAAADFLPLIEGDEGAHVDEAIDPHIWLDFGLDQMVVDHLAEVFAEVDAEGALSFRTAAARYNGRLKKLDQDYATGLDRCAHKTIVVGGHAAFGYLAKRYGLDQISLYGQSPDAEPTPRRLRIVIDWAKERQVKAVFTESNTSSKMARVLAEEIGAELLELHPGENLNRKEWSSGRTFIEIMEENLRNLKRGLVCD